MTFKIACLVLSLAVVCFGYANGLNFDDFGNIDAKIGISGALSETKDALNQAGKKTSDALSEAKNEISNNPVVKDATDVLSGFGKAFSGFSIREKSESRTTQKSSFVNDSAFSRSGEFGSSSNGFGDSSFDGQSGFGGFGRPYGSGGHGFNGLGNNGFGSKF